MVIVTMVTYRYESGDTICANAARKLCNHCAALCQLMSSTLLLLAVVWSVCIAAGEHML